MASAKTLPSNLKKARNKYTEEFMSDLAKKLLVWIKEPGNIWLGSFAVENGFHRSRFQKFCEKSEEFSEAFEVAKQHQENKLFLGGLTNKLNGYMTWCALKNVADWRDKTDVNIGGQQDNPLGLHIVVNRPSA